MAVTCKTFKECIAAAATRLKNSESARLDAELLLSYVTRASRASLIAWPDRQLTHEQAAQFSEMVERRAQGEPLAYITGEREFWSFALKVTPDTLIPRPETELLVEQSLACVPQDAAWRLADLGTGSGAVALAIASERPRCSMIATDASAAALAVARENAERLSLKNVSFRQGRWFEPLQGERFHLIASNPPYVAENDPHLHDLRYEPSAALASGADGLDDIREIIAEAPKHLFAGGWLLLEHGWDQGPAVKAIMQERGFKDVVVHPDLEGRDRVTAGRVDETLAS